MATKPTVAEARGWLKLTHTQDDAQLTLALAAAWNEYQAATGRLEADLTDAEKVAILERVANLYGFRGDDSVGPSTWFVDTIRRMNNPNSVG